MHTIITAVPGSGKTTTLAQKIRSAIDTGIDPRAIYAVTFTREAARELKERCHPGIHASTVHSLAFRIIAHNSGSAEHDAFASGLCYDDMLIKAQSMAASFRAEILAIDEAQDLSELQFAFLQSLVPGTKNVIVVGDSMQSIFSFSGGDPRYMHAFKEILPGVQTVSLDTSYRVPHEISSFINNAFQPPVPIISEKEGGVVTTHMVPEAGLFTRMIDALTSNTGILFRTNAEIIRMLRMSGPRTREMNYTLPLTAHPYVAFAIAVVGLGASVSPGSVRRAAGMLGGLSWGSARALALMDGLELTRESIDRLFGPGRRADAGGDHDIPVMSQKVRKEIYTLIEVLDMYKEFYGKSDYGSIRGLFAALERDGYAVDSLWKESVPSIDILVEAVMRKARGGPDASAIVNNGSTAHVMTIHAAKGKEFDRVLLAVNARNVDIYEEEEFRILYVGCTRARESLDVFVPACSSHNHARRNILDIMSASAAIL